MQTIETKKPSLFTLVLLVSFASVSAVLYTPALPELAQKLDISAAKAQLTITLFLIGYTLGVLPYGPLSDRYGRKPAAYIGVSIAILGNLMILLVNLFPQFWLLLAGRLLVAVGSCVGLKIAFTMVGDAWQHEEATKKISSLLLSWSIVPAVAIGIGGFLTERFGWMSCFYFLTCYSIFILLLTFTLPETSKQIDPHALKVKAIAEGYRLKVQNKKLICSAFIMGCGTAVIYLFAAQSPFIAINLLGLSPEKYGLWNFITPIGMIAGSMLANTLAGKKEPLFLMLVGIGIVLFFQVLMLVLFLIGIVSIWSLFLPMPFMYLGETLVYVNATSLILSHAKNKSYASATMSFINMGMCVVVLFAYGAVPSQSIYMMPLFFTLLGMAMFVLRKRLAALQA